MEVPTHFLFSYGIVSNALVELKLSAWMIYRSVIYLATTDL